MVTGRNLGLEGTDEMGEEGILPGERQHPLLHHGALHVVILDHHVLLQDFDGVQFLCSLPVSKHHLGTEGEKAQPGTVQGVGAEVVMNSVRSQFGNSWCRSVCDS